MNILDDIGVSKLSGIFHFKVNHPLRLVYADYATGHWT